MSLSLEERRAERRRQRQLKDDVTNGTKFPDELHADVQERLARRRQERLNRISGIASGGITVNGDDDLERKRRERREARLRASEDTTDDYTSRRNRRRGTEEDITNTEDDYSSSLSRRHRNWDDNETPTTVNDTPSVPDTSEEDAAAERRRRQREEEEEEARRQQEKEAEEQRRQDDLRRQREEEEQRRREEAAREEEERQRRREDEQPDLSGVEQNTEDEEEDPDILAAESKLFIDEDQLLNRETVKQEDRLDRVKQWNNANNANKVLNVGVTSDDVVGGHKDKFTSDDLEKGSDRNKGVISGGNIEEGKGKTADIGRGRKTQDDFKNQGVSLGRSASFKEREIKEINNNKIKDKLNQFEQPHQAASAKAVKDSKTVVPVSEKKEGLKGRLEKFEQEIKDQEKAAKEKTGVLQSNSKREPAVFSTPSQKVSAKLQQFEVAMKSQSATKASTRNAQTELEKIGSSKSQRQALLGRWSSSETQINNTVLETAPRKNILDRWKPSQETPKPNSMSPVGRKDVVTKTLSGNTEFIAARYLEKASKSIEEPISPRSAVFDEKSPSSLSRDRYPSLSSERSPGKKKSFDAFENQSELNDNRKQSRSHVLTDKRPPKEPGMLADLRPVVHSRGSSYDDSFEHSRGSSVDASSERSGRYSQLEQEEEERLEQERLEEERQEESRMAEEQKKRKGKKKGLGGLTPEKKKLLKQIIMQKAAEDLKKEALAKAEEKEKFINSRVEPILTEGIGEAELRKLCKKLHQTLAQIHSETYDLEFKVGKQEQEVTTLTNKVNDSKGKFVKPVLRKVNKTEQKFAKLAKKAEAKAEAMEDFRDTLKSTTEEESLDLVPTM